MRIIGHLENEAHARVFGDYLYAQGIQNNIEPDREGTWAIWVHGEDELDKATSLLDRFQKNPGDVKYQNAQMVAQDRREHELSEDQTARKRHFDRSRLVPGRGFGMGRLTMGLIVICVGVYLLRLGGGNVSWLFISETHGTGLVEVTRGQLWRLVTPILLHFSPLHILFNMLWLWQLGSMMELLRGWRRYAIFLLSTAVISNLGQFIASGPAFGGMSGVVYALLGYAWVRGKLDPASGFFVEPQIVLFMTVWFFICLFGFIPGVANTAHGVGFASGIAWGYLAARRTNG
jgi:GlpG protein